MLTTTSRRVEYVGNSATTVFAVPFRFLANGHVTVYEFDDDGDVVDTYTEGPDYTLTGAGENAGGEVTFAAAPAAGINIGIKRTTPRTQPNDLVQFDTLPAEAVEEQLDRALMVAQELEDDMSTIAIGTTPVGLMTKSAYDPNDDGVVEEALRAVDADSADYVHWDDVDAKPDFFAPINHNTAHMLGGSDSVFPASPVAGRVLKVAAGGTTLEWGVDATGGAGDWGDIGGVITDQLDLVAALDAKQALDATLTALAALNGTAGLVEQTGADTFTKRLIGASNDSDILTRVLGDARWQTLDATLTALAGLNSTAGLVEQTGTDAFTKRLIGVTNTTDIPTRAQGDARWQTLDATLTALAALDSTAGLLEQTGADTFARRAIGVSTTTSIPTRADGDARWQTLDATLTALAALDSTAGLLEQTGADTFVRRSIGVSATTSIPTRADGDARWQTLDATLTALAALDGTAGLLEVTGADTFARRAMGVAASTSVLTRADGDGRYQPLDSDLTAIAALTTTSYGRSALTWADVHAANTAFGLAKVINVKHYGCVGDGVTNDSTNFTAAMGAMTDGSTLLIPPGTYLVSSRVFANLDRISIVGYGKGVSIIKAATASNILEVQGTCEQVTIEGITWDGSCTTRTAGQQAVKLDCNKVRFINCEILNSGEYALSLGRNTALDGFEIFGATIRACYADGINLYQSDNGIVSHCVVDGADDDLLAIGDCENVQVTGCLFRTRTDLATSWGRGIAILGGAKTININACLVEKVKQTGLYIWSEGGTPPSGISVTGVKVRNAAINSGAAASVNDAVDVNIKCCTFEDVYSGDLMNIIKGTRLAVQNCDFVQNLNQYCRAIFTTDSWGTESIDGLYILNNNISLYQANSNGGIVIKKRDTMIATATTSGTTATLVFPNPHGKTTGNSITVSSAPYAELNGTFTVTVTNSTTLTYTMSGATTPPNSGGTVDTNIALTGGFFTNVVITGNTGMMHSSEYLIFTRNLGANSGIYNNTSASAAAAYFHDTGGGGTAPNYGNNNP